MLNKINLCCARTKTEPTKPMPKPVPKPAFKRAFDGTFDTNIAAQIGMIIQPEYDQAYTRELKMHELGKFLKENGYKRLGQDLILTAKPVRHFFESLKPQQKPAYAISWKDTKKRLGEDLYKRFENDDRVFAWDLD